MSGLALVDELGRPICRRCRLPRAEDGHERGCAWYGRQAVAGDYLRDPELDAIGVADEVRRDPA